jgi:2-keto-4-pentenoate hydratase
LSSPAFDPEAIAAAFVTARATGRAMAAFPGVLPSTMEQAYRIQDAAIRRVDRAIGGWKVGRIFPPQSVQFGAERLAGPIFASTIHVAGEGVAVEGVAFENGFAAAEAEFLLRIGSAADGSKQHYSLAEAAALVDRVHIGIEIASSPLGSINALGPAVTASDFGNNNGLIVGPEVTDWRSAGFADWSVVTSLDGTIAGAGRASAFPDGPIGSVRFLLENLAARGIAVPAGTWVSTGAITGVHAVAVGQQVRAAFGPSLLLSCSIGRVVVGG